MKVNSAIKCHGRLLVGVSLVVQANVYHQIQEAARGLSVFRDALGGERFREQIEALGRRRAASKGVGRPRKEKKSCLTPIFLQGAICGVALIGAPCGGGFPQPPPDRASD